MNEQIMGFYSENILVNLTPKPYLDVESRIYRLRVLNGSNSRTYKLAFLNKLNKLKYYIIGTDGGLLNRPYQAEEVFISPGERVDILIDFEKLNIGDTVYLKSIKFDPMHNEDMGMMNHSMNNMNTSNDSVLPEGSEYFIMKFNVKYEVKEKNQIPEVLSVIKPIEKNNLKIRKFVLSLSGMQWLINGLSFRMNDYPVEVKKNTKEIWEFYNSKQSMPHPMHIHGIQFQVIERINSPNQVKMLSIDKNGRLVTDLGWKDTVQVWPDETVRIIIDFSNNYSGVQNYVFHCHILEHEDMGMMINYRIIE